MKELYGYFLRNQIPWRKINGPYINKFADVILLEYEGIFDKDETIEKVEYDLGEFQIYERVDQVPLWNITPTKIKSTSLSIPSEEECFFRHILQLDEVNGGNGLLLMIEEEFEGRFHRNEKGIVVDIDSRKEDDWIILKILQDERELDDEHYALPMSNGIKDSFIYGFAYTNESNIRTRSDLERKINSYKVSEILKFKSYHIENKSREDMIYAMEPHEEDEIGEWKDKKYMVLLFEPKLQQ